MPRKTPEPDVRKTSRQAASMRPRPDAAENEVDGGVQGRVDPLQ